ncbi:helix-turn-helix domain-containing protein [Paenibacillus sp. P96]|uniref:Helix-turn-helix domain-containing protein n=1 Tax=Paenibacillus zeirhizosphaerae TaxID=2987519 RepID=A0ABT9FX02_9BACL|nr:transcriptional regulator [Paenibacillus sp. P96]MDP4098997.1 helix-turn-helix domain-containing protein [Paenibacillus sp. P96]
MQNPSFGKYLKQLREQRKVSINQLAEAAGISNSQISRIENGLRGIPKPATIRKIADSLSVPYAEIMKQAGYLENDASEEATAASPSWATSRDRRDFKKMLEEDGELMFDGIPLDEEDKRRIKDVLTGLFWEAKQMNKRKPPASKKK